MPVQPSYQLRTLLAEDVSAVRDLILAGLEEHWGWLDPQRNPDLDNILEYYRSEWFLVGELDGRIIATGALLAEQPGVARIVRMSVARSERRKGVGRSLLIGLLGLAQATGFQQVVVETTATWEDAVSFYRNCGFQELGEREGDRHFALDLKVRTGSPRN